MFVKNVDQGKRRRGLYFPLWGQIPFVTGMQRIKKNSKQCISVRYRESAALLQMWKKIESAGERKVESLYIVLLIYLVIESRRDIRKKEISVKNTAGFAIAALLLRVGNLGIRLVTGNITIKSIGFLLTALAPGIFLLAFGLITRQAIGYGDGLMLLVCGLCLGGKTAGVLLITGMFLFVRYRYICYCSKGQKGIPSCLLHRFYWVPI